MIDTIVAISSLSLECHPPAFQILGIIIIGTRESFHHPKSDHEPLETNPDLEWQSFRGLFFFL